MKPQRKRKPVVAAPQPASQTLPPARKPWWPHAAALIAILLASVALYSRTLELGFFQLDDADYVLNNTRIENFSPTKLKLILTEPYFANYSPAHLLSYALDVALAGGKPAFAFHLSNVLWHGLAAGAVYWLAWALRADVLTAAIAALLFAAHPAHVEVVAWISSRKDLVATVFATLAMTCYLLHRRKKSWPWYALAVASFLVASAGKQSVALLPLVMLVWDVVVEQRRSWRPLADKIPFGLITVFFALRTAAAQPDTRNPFSVFKLGAAFLENLWLMTGLGDYVLYRTPPDARTVSSLTAVLVPVLALVVFAAPFFLRRWFKAVYRALTAWVLIQMIPPMVLNFLTPVSDRYLFLPSVGFCILVALILQAIAKPPIRPPVALALTAGIAVLWGAKTWTYVGEWSDPRSVWFAAKTKTASAQVREFLGTLYQDTADRLQNFILTGEPLRATHELALARAVLQDQAVVERLLAEWQANPAAKTNSMAYRGRLLALAWDEFEAAKARVGTLSAPNLFLHRGKLLVSRGKPAEAVAELEHALQLARNHSYDRIRQEDVTLIARALGITYWNMTQYTNALRWYREAQRVQRDSGQVWSPTLETELETVRRLAGER